MRRFQGMVPPSAIVRASFDDTRGAIFGGPSESHRYLLWRQAMEREEMQCTFLMLNPSTADEEVLDPTLRRCWSFTSAWGYNRMEIVNLFAYRATQPHDMVAAGAAAVGELNDWFILDSCQRARLVVCAWGTMGAHMGRAAAVVTLLRDAGVELTAMHLTKGGHPGHPLYLRGGLRPSAWGGATC